MTIRHPSIGKARHDRFAVLDIGTTKVVCYIAHLDILGDVTIEGIGHHLSAGVRSGVITDIKAAEAAIVAAVHAAEQMADARIDSVVVNLSGGGVTSHNVHVALPLAGQAIGKREIARLVEYGKNSLRSQDRDVIHCIPISFTIDEARGIRDPHGMFGNQFGADLHVITASSTALKNLTQCIGRAQLDVEEFIVSSYASGLACLSEDERQLGATLVDIGGGTTSVAVFVDGHPLYTDLVPVGGLHVTNDLARGLSTSITAAERIKALYGSTFASPSDAHEVIDVPQISVHHDPDQWESNAVPRSMLSGIIRPRMEEIFEMVRARLETSGFDRLAGRKVVLTGGGSQLLGAVDLASRVFNKQVRLGKPKYINGLAESTIGAAFSTSVGLVEYSAHKLRTARHHHDQNPHPMRGSMGRAIEWVKELI